ncbi:putative zinc-binding metallopeptidase [Rhizobium cauense]|uniref:zinc-binding metallopeptidase family protein n=1 Tax=Rhizobium cauense TaxID=1166683 RepID=UPI001C6EFE5A|nr:putative zinc-binding metallopeptidase [Rhizobium cauense]MBW9117648.1 putative zinc-binding metallopeptidase [Rhizobium cauense]
MRLFACDSCGQIVHFDNRSCVKCGARLGFDADKLAMFALEADGAAWRLAGQPTERRQFCRNEAIDVCNWLVADENDTSFCVACRHNRLVPNASTADGLNRWRRIGQAQRHLFYSLLKWNLPLPERLADPQGGLVFDFLEDQLQPDGNIVIPKTGHEEGVISIRAAEADDVTLAHVRTSMNEPYRTLLGHFRHETGHFIWNKLVRDKGCFEEFRRIFGDEREDYDEALQRYYSHGPKPNWQASFISAYASSHPWEDFAESFAHLLHIVDTLETARAFGITIEPRGHEEIAAQILFDPYRARSGQQLVDAWVPLSIAVNAIQRSMGQKDSYPFVMSNPVTMKLGYLNGLLT